TRPRAAPTGASAPTAVAAAQPEVAPTVAPPTTVPPTAVPPPPTSAEASALAGAAVELRLPTTEPSSLDPGLASDAVSVGLIVHLFEGLVAQDADGNLEARIAETWDVSDDGLTYT